MGRWTWTSGCAEPPTAKRSRNSGERLIADGGSDQEDETAENASGPEDESDAEADDTAGRRRANVEVTEAGEAEPAEPKWEPPDIENVEDIPEVTGPKTRPADSERADAVAGEKNGGTTGGRAVADTDASGGQTQDPTAGMPNTARSPEGSRVNKGGTDGYVVALELCARLSEDIRLPDEAADLVPVAFEAELEENVQRFAGEQFDNPSPHVETLDFVEADDEIWLRLRLGIPPESFADIDPEEIRDHALQKLEGMF